jgi:putative flippase GtrA
MQYLLSSTLSFTLSAVVNYFLSVAWVFARRNKCQRSTEVTIFVAVCFVALLLNDLFMWLFTSKLGLYYLTSKLVTVVIVFFWSYTARRVMFHSTWQEFLTRNIPFNRFSITKADD